LARKVGDSVRKGQILARVYADKPVTEEILQSLQAAFVIVPDPVQKPAIIREIIR
jgi:thymidine phosphorylase